MGRNDDRTQALRRLDVLIGDWEVEPIVDGRSVGRSRTTFEWVEGGAFLRQYSEADADFAASSPEWQANAPFPTTSLIGLDDSTDLFTMLYADARDVFRVYQVSVVDGVWRQWRDAPGFNQRFTGILSEDDTTIDGLWEMSEDGRTWRKDFDLVYRRTARP